VRNVDPKASFLLLPQYLFFNDLRRHVQHGVESREALGFLDASTGVLLVRDSDILSDFRLVYPCLLSHGRRDEVVVIPYKHV
jgi:hypothetical protein